MIYPFYCNCFMQIRIREERQLNGHTMSEYARNVVAQVEIEHKTAGLFEPAG
jgi:hypothetical protein